MRVKVVSPAYDALVAAGDREVEAADAIACHPVSSLALLVDKLNVMETILGHEDEIDASAIYADIRRLAAQG